MKKSLFPDFTDKEIEKLTNENQKAWLMNRLGQVGMHIIDHNEPYNKPVECEFIHINGTIYSDSFVCKSSVVVVYNKRTYRMFCLLSEINFSIKVIS